MSKEINIKQVDAFSDKAFGGNPAGVVLNANSLDEEEMLLIAREMNLSETAFVVSSDKSDFRIRWFTTQKEVLFCGHATVAAIHAIGEEGLYSTSEEGEYSFEVETLVGILNVRLIKNQDDLTVFLEAPQSSFSKEDIDIDFLTQSLNISRDSLAQLPIYIDRTIDYMFIPLQSLHYLKSYVYNYHLLKTFGEKYSIKGFSLFTTDTFEEANNVHSRFFCPYYDDIEDPCTGSANAPLAKLLVMHEIVEMSENNTFVLAEQGDFIDRPSRLKIKVEKSGGDLKSTIVGNAFTVINGVMRF
jgi:trans-2,3-dihydro-3-hydroxyanthranilate isomerase